MDNILKDKRFKAIVTDPVFRNVPRAHRKVKIDKRFQSMFNDKRFQLKYSVDKRGRPINESQAENFRKYYELSSDESDSDTKPKSKKEVVKGNTFKVSEAGETISKEETELCESEDLNDTEKSEIISDVEFKNHLLNKTEDKDLNSDSGRESEEEQDSEIDEKLKLRLQDMTFDYARGVGILQSESSSDESSSDESESENIQHPWGELDKDAETTDDATRRIAICHMDWDRITAQDLMVLLNSFVPPNGLIESIVIYPSEFGLERMKEEEIKGPKELVDGLPKLEVEAEEEVQGEDGNKYHMEKLREYQLKRLKYFYAIVTCDSAETANKLYSECDGMEFESSATKLDMRFVPDEMTFEAEPRETCTSVPDASKYKPKYFANTALQQGKVNLTWDETDPNRIELTKKVMSGADIPEDELKAVIATSSSDENESDEEKKSEVESDKNESDDDGTSVGENKRIEKYRSLLASIQDEREKKEQGEVEMEISWGVGLKEKTEKLAEEKKKSQMTPFEKIIEKQKEKKKQKRDQAKNKEHDSDNLFSDDDVPSDVDLEDDFFKRDEKGISKRKNKGKKKSFEDEDNVENGELELLLANDNEEERGKKHFSLKSIQESEAGNTKKRKKWKKNLKRKNEVLEEDNFKVDVADERFSALYHSHHFNIDPADPHFRKTKGTEDLISEKQRRMNNNSFTVQPDSKKPKLVKNAMGAELSQLVRSVKEKTKF